MRNQAQKNQLRNIFLVGVPIMIMASLIMLFTVGCTQSQSANVSANREHAEAWVKQALPGFTLAGFSSSTLDQDDDGYITVDISVKRENSTELRLIQLDCPTAGKFLQIQKGGGCKYKQMPFDARF